MVELGKVASAKYMVLEEHLVKVAPVEMIPKELKWWNGCVLVGSLYNISKSTQKETWKLNPHFWTILTLDSMDV